MQLTGTVTLDEKSMSLLTEKIREDVVDDIKNNGLYVDECVKCMENFPIHSYLNAIKRSIDSQIEYSKNHIFADNRTKKLMLIKAVLEL